MRRKELETSQEEAMSFLETGLYGTLSMVDRDGLPYAVPLNYAVMEGAVYFHCATEGRKLNIIQNNPNVCFTVVSRADMAPQKFTCLYQSVHVAGKAQIIESKEEKTAALKAICLKYSSEYMDAAIAYINKDIDKTCCVKIHIVSMTGKSKFNNTSL